MIDNKLTYISLFSSAGVGCYGFKMEDFECILTNEMIEKRINIQKLNNKCKYSSGYICGDITDINIQNKIYEEIDFWKSKGNDRVDVVIATPPCQGMSVANHKKKEDEINRNSLIVESVKIVKKIKPRFFIFENVSAFWKTGCYHNEEIKSIGDMITSELLEEYNFENRVLNFKNYGANSSRTRTLVIGVSKDENIFTLPSIFYPKYREEKTLRTVIGDMKNLDWGEYDNSDFYHSFRVYPEHMRNWIKNIDEGQSAFDNEDDELKPHKIVDGKLVINQSKNGDKYKRQIFDKVAPCIHTRTDQLASQNTVHPKEDRVFSIRELMKLMTIPDDFKWIDVPFEILNNKSIDEKRKISKKEELNIRQSIGEAVPTEIFRQIASNIKKYMSHKFMTEVEINKLISSQNLQELGNLKKFIREYKNDFHFETLSRIIELSNSKRNSHSAFYTTTEILKHIMSILPEFDKEEISILEPSVGSGNFLPLIFNKYFKLKKIKLTVVDLDVDILEVLKMIFTQDSIPNNVEIKFVHADYLNTFFDEKFDLIIGNPPFSKLSSKELSKYGDSRELKQNNKREMKLFRDLKNRNELSFSPSLTNMAGLFLEKALVEAKNLSLVLPKNILNTTEYEETRSKLKNTGMTGILDFGELGFKGVLIETVNISVSENANEKILVKSIPKNKELLQDKKYIFDEKLPYWVIYRDSFFDKIFRKMNFNIFSVFRDRQITNSMLKNGKGSNNDIRVLKSRNISDDGKEILNIENYDSYIAEDLAKKLSVYKYKQATNVYLTPNMTYKPRILKKDKIFITNGSIAILSPKSENTVMTKAQMEYISTEEFRKFYAVARNFQTRSLNIDNTSVYWFGINREV